MTALGGIEATRQLNLYDHHLKAKFRKLSNYALESPLLKFLIIKVEDFMANPLFGVSLGCATRTTNLTQIAEVQL